MDSDPDNLRIEYVIKVNNKKDSAHVETIRPVAGDIIEPDFGKNNYKPLSFSKLNKNVFKRPVSCTIEVADLDKLDSAFTINVIATEPQSEGSEGASARTV